MTFRKECVKAAFQGLCDGFILWAGFALVAVVVIGGIYLLNTYAPPVFIVGVTILFALGSLYLIGVSFYIPIKLRLEKAGCLTKKESEEYED